MAYIIYEALKYIPGVEKSLNYIRENLVPLMEQHCVPSKVMPIIAVYTYFLFWHIISDLPWILWKHLLIDYLLVIAFPLYMAVFSDTINSVWEYSLYERKNFVDDIDNIQRDVRLYIWEDVKYYSFIKKDKLSPCGFGCDVFKILKVLRKYVVNEEQERAGE